MLNKKGISPLITTILLVAFAVAFGASFVSYAGAFFEKKELSKTAQCNDYLVSIFKIDPTKSPCLAQSSTPLALKFKRDQKPASETKCYISIASGTSRLCNKKAVKVNETWVPTEFKI